MLLKQGDKVLVDNLLRVHNEPFSISGVQAKLQARSYTFTGVVRHIRSDHHKGDGVVAVWIEPDDKLSAPSSQKCHKCGLFEVPAIPLNNIKPLV